MKAKAEMLRGRGAWLLLGWFARGTEGAHLSVPPPFPWVFLHRLLTYTGRRGEGSAPLGAGGRGRGGDGVVGGEAGAAGPGDTSGQMCREGEAGRQGAFHSLP